MTDDDRTTPREPETWFQLGMTLLREKKLAEAAKAFREVVALKPDDARTWNNLSVVLRLQGRPTEAESCSQRAVELQPAASALWLNLASSQFNQQKYFDASESIRRAIAIDPTNAMAHSNLCVALLEQDKAVEAEEWARRAVALDAANAEFWGNLGAGLFAQRRWPEAADAYRHAAERAPENAAVWGNLGAAELSSNRLAEAQEALERTLALAPDEPGAVVNYASLLARRGQPRLSAELLQGLLDRQPSFAPAWAAMGDALRLLGDMEQATAALRRALELAPKQFEVRYNLALVLSHRWFLAEAESIVREILADEPTAAVAWAQLGVVLHMQARHEEGLAALARSVALEPNRERHSTLLFHQQYAGEVTQESLLSAHREWNDLHATSVQNQRPTRESRNATEGFPHRPAQRPLRIGFVSEDFRLHPIGFFALPALAALDKGKCEVVCYSDVVSEDAFTARFRSASSQWRAIAGLSNEEVAEQVRKDEIDVLVDLAGHTSKRLIVFAHKPAPVQMTWLGYVGTTGLSAMDYLLADRFHVRPEEEKNYVETVLRMPHGFACYEPPDYAPPVGLLPALASGRFTFGSFNNPAKLSRRTLDAWSEILGRAAGSRLLLKYGGLHQAETQERIRQQFAERGVEPERIMIEGRSPEHWQLLDRYNQVDLALDTLPYSGCLTTCEALWMGVPVVSYPGPTFAGRPTASHLTNVGLEQFIGRNAKEYVDLAVNWASRVKELAAIRAGLRERVRKSPLCDAPGFAADFLAIVRQAWATRMAGTS